MVGRKTAGEWEEEGVRDSDSRAKGEGGGGTSKQEERELDARISCQQDKKRGEERTGPYLSHTTQLCVFRGRNHGTTEERTVGGGGLEIGANGKSSGVG